MRIALDKRLSAIYNEIIPCKTLADIGCDHGKLIVKAVIDMKCERAIAADISADSLNKAIKLAVENGVDGAINFIVSDGFDDISEDFDTAVLSGLGANEIVSILERRKLHNKRLILSPNKNGEVLRRFLIKNNYVIVEDYIVCNNGYYYDIIVCDLAKIALEYDRFSIEYGKFTKNIGDYLTYLDKTIARISAYSVKLNKDRRAEENIKIDYLNDIRDRIR